MKILILAFVLPTFLSLLTGCESNPNASLIGRWQGPRENGSYIEIIEDGSLISHVDLSSCTWESREGNAIFNCESNIPIVLNEPTNLYVDVKGRWEIINKSELIFTLEFDEIISDTNSIIRVSENEMVLDINGTNTTYTRVE